MGLKSAIRVDPPGFPFLPRRKYNNNRHITNLLLDPSSPSILNNQKAIMQGARSIPSSDMPLLSRLDHLDFILKRLEGRQNLSRWGSSGGNNLLPGPEGQPVTVDIAAKEAYFKGSLLDRVASLETRLFQICLDIESSSTSGNSSSQITSGYASSSQGSKSEPSFSSSLPVFTTQHQGLKPVSHYLHPNISEIQELTKKEEQGRQDSDPVKQKGEKSGVTVDDRSSKSCKKKKKKKRKISKWTPLKILGC